MIFVLGLDGLDCGFVEQWKLKHLLQVEHGEVSVPVDAEKHVPLSPEVWASFLCGKNVKATFKRVQGKRRKFNVGFMPIRETTFLDVLISKTVNAPFYDCDYANYQTLNKLARKEITLTGTIEITKKYYESYKEKILDSAKNSDTQIVFAYMPYPDDFQHLLFTRPEEIKHVYYDLNDWVGILKQELKNNLLCIVSDHGFNMDKGIHSLKAFYSFSKEIGYTPKDITDFFNIFSFRMQRVE